jgi:hypothetical protein
MMKRAFPVVSTSVAILFVATCAWAEDQSAEPKTKAGDDTFKCITTPCTAPALITYWCKALWPLPRRGGSDCPEGSVVQFGGEGTLGRTGLIGCARPCPTSGNGTFENCAQVCYSVAIGVEADI